MDEFEEAGDDDLLVAGIEQMQHEPLGELIEREDDEREREDAAARLVENGAQEMIEWQKTTWKIPDLNKQ